MKTKVTECSGCKGKSRSQIFVATAKGFICLACLLKIQEGKND